MLATFVIGLREGLEAALIVGIIAAFLKRRNRTDALRKCGSASASRIVLCLAVGFTLQRWSSARCRSASRKCSSASSPPSPW